MKYVLIFLCLLLGSGAALAGDGPAPPEISAKSAILIDAVTGTVLYEKDARVKRPPASTTKIITAILALENGDLDEKVSASTYASSTPFGSLHLKAGEILTLRDLLYALLLRSANDAAVSIGEHMAGSEAQFVEMMNAKAQAIGAKDTHFKNPHGLHHPEHLSTAYDLAEIARYAVRNPVFNEMVNTRSMRIDRSINRLDVTLRNTADFLRRFDGADGLKTGYTKQAGHCFVGSATRDGWRLISVVLNSPSAGHDTEALIAYGFKFYKPVVFASRDTPVRTVRIHGGVIDKVDLVPTRDYALVLRKHLSAEARTEVKLDKAVAPVEKGEKLGELHAYLNGEKVGHVDLVAAEHIARTFAATMWYYIRILLTIACIFLVGYVAYGTAVAEIARRRRRGISQRSREADHRRTRRR